MASYKPVTAALRVLDVLAAVNRLGARATLAEIHHEAGIDKATTLRMLETLIHGGYVLRERNPAVYRPTGKTLALGSAYDRHRIVSTLISDDLAEFRQQVGWPSDVALMDQDAMLVVKSSRQGEPLHFVRASGFRAPVLVTSLGLAYLAYCPADEREDFIRRAAADPSRFSDLARNRDMLDAKLAKVREQGYATMEESYSRNIYDSQFFSLGVPVKTEERVFASINVIYLRSALTEAAAKEQLLPPLHQVAGRMAIRLRDNLTF